MEFRAYKRLSPKLKSAVLEFLGSENADRFMLKTPGVRAIGNLPAHYAVFEQYPHVLAYGEAVFVDENSELEIEFCTKNNTSKAGELLLSGIKELAKDENLTVLVRSSLPDDKVLNNAGFKMYDADYLMQYSGIPEKSDNILKCSLEFRKESEPGCDEVLLFSLLSADRKKCFSSCAVYEYSSSVCITDVFTGEEYRRKGFGMELIKRITEIYSSQGKDIVLHVSGTNEKAFSLYKKMGFSVKESLFTYKTL